MAHAIEIVDVVYTAEYFHDFWEVLEELQNENIRLVRYRYRRLPGLRLRLCIAQKVFVVFAQPRRLWARVCAPM